LALNPQELEEEPEWPPSHGLFINLQISEWTPSHSSRIVPNLQSDCRFSAAIHNVFAPRKMTPFRNNKTYRRNGQWVYKCRWRWFIINFCIYLKFYLIFNIFLEIDILKEENAYLQERIDKLNWQLKNANSKLCNLQLDIS
jgi:hypothetical protein